MAEKTYVQPFGLPFRQERQAQVKNMEQNKTSELRDRLESKEKFLPLLDYFIKKAIEEQKSESDGKDGSLMFTEFYEQFMDNYPRINVDNVFKYCESPIEKIFINSLILLFLKNGYMGLHITDPFKNAELDIKNYRTAHKNIIRLTEEYKKMTGDEDMRDFEAFFQKKICAGQFTTADYHTFEYHRTIVENFTWNAYHLTLQACFPDFKVDGKCTRVDILIWVPGDDKFKLVVECDGFQYHNTKDSFERDRKRDRLFKSKGYQVIRFSGAEIFRDPVAVSSELFDFIDAMDKNENTSA